MAKNNLKLFEALTETIERFILPKTEAGVAAGNKMFGAAILNKMDLSVICAETNNEIDNPLFHGEITTLNKFFESFRNYNPSDCIFLSTHEPCSMCLSAIAWGGFDTIFYLFSHQDSRDEHKIPHDLNILQEVFNLAPGEYNSENYYWTCTSLQALIDTFTGDVKRDSEENICRLRDRYSNLSNLYQSNKSGNKIPLN